MELIGLIYVGYGHCDIFILNEFLAQFTTIGNTIHEP